MMNGIMNIRLFFLLCVAGTFSMLVVQLLLQLLNVPSSRKHVDANALILQVETVRNLIVSRSGKHSETRGITLSSQKLSGITTTQGFPLSKDTHENNITTGKRKDSDNGSAASTNQHHSRSRGNNENNITATPNPFRRSHGKPSDIFTIKTTTAHLPNRREVAPTVKKQATQKKTAARKEKQTDTPTHPAIAGQKWRGKLTNKQKFITKVENHIKRLPRGSLSSTFLGTVIQRAKSRGKGWQSLQNKSVLDTQFIYYLKCPTSVRVRMMSGQTKKHFVAETPILAWNEHYSKAEYQRLSNFHGIFGWKDMKEGYVASALAALNSSHNRYLFDTRMVNGSIPNDNKCIRCAIVGNGGILNGSRMGKEIDANDYVFRVNTALTKGHEKDVGTRTSFYCFTLSTYINTLAQRFVTRFHNPPIDKGIRYVFFPESEWSYSYISATLNRRRPPMRSTGKGWLMSPPKFPKQLTANNVKLVHPDFIRYLKLSWINSKDKNKSIHRPTTGAIMLLLALHTCDEVNAYGFGGSPDRFSDHYYDRAFVKRRRYVNHDNDAEDHLWHLLHKRGIINLYTRD